MKQKSAGRPSSPEKIIRDIKRKTRKQYSAEEKIRIVLDGLRGEDSIAELCRREGIAQSLYYKWSKDFMEAGKKRLAGDIVRQANTSEVTDLRREARDLKEVVAEQTLELRSLKKSMIGDQQFLRKSPQKISTNFPIMVEKRSPDLSRQYATLQVLRKIYGV